MVSEVEMETEEAAEVRQRFAGAARTYLREVESGLFGLSRNVASLNLCAHQLCADAMDARTADELRLRAQGSHAAAQAACAALERKLQELGRALDAEADASKEGPELGKRVLNA